jgi:hypothetical protein
MVLWVQNVMLGIFLGLGFQKPSCIYLNGLAGSILMLMLMFIYGAQTTVLTDSFSGPNSGSLSLPVILSLSLWLWSNILCYLMPFHFLEHGNTYIQYINPFIHPSIDVSINLPTNEWINQMNGWID